MLMVAMLAALVVLSRVLHLKQMEKIKQLREAQKTTWHAQMEKRPH